MDSMQLNLSCSDRAALISADDFERELFVEFSDLFYDAAAIEAFGASACLNFPASALAGATP